MKSYGVYYLDDPDCERPINMFDHVNLIVRDGAYIFYVSNSQRPLAVYPVNSFYVLEVAQ